ncbi:MAG: DUF3791 domain-containing protein [Eubacteriales bacterium]
MKTMNEQWKENSVMLAGEKNINSYIVCCVSEFADKYGLKENQAFQYLEEYQAIEFLKQNYEVEHTLSFEEV